MSIFSSFTRLKEEASEECKDKEATYVWLDDDLTDLFPYVTVLPQSDSNVRARIK